MPNELFTMECAADTLSQLAQNVARAFIYAALPDESTNQNMLATRRKLEHSCVGRGFFGNILVVTLHSG